MSVCLPSPLVFAPYIIHAYNLQTRAHASPHTHTHTHTRYRHIIIACTCPDASNELRDFDNAESHFRLAYTASRTAAARKSYMQIALSNLNWDVYDQLVKEDGGTPHRLDPFEALYHNVGPLELRRYAAAAAWDAVVRSLCCCVHDVET